MFKCSSCQAYRKRDLAVYANAIQQALAGTFEEESCVGKGSCRGLDMASMSAEPRTTVLEMWRPRRLSALPARTLVAAQQPADWLLHHAGSSVPSLANSVLQ